MQLQEQNSDNLVVVTLNVDFDSTEGLPSKELIDKATLTLQGLDVACLNRIASSPLEDVLSEFGLFGLPAAILYSVDGEIVERFDGGVDVMGVVAPKISKLLSEK